MNFCMCVGVCWWGRRPRYWPQLLAGFGSRCPKLHLVWGGGPLWTFPSSAPWGQDLPKDRGLAEMLTGPQKAPTACHQEPCLGSFPPRQMCPQLCHLPRKNTKFLLFKEIRRHRFPGVQKLSRFLGLILCKGVPIPLTLLAFLPHHQLIFCFNSVWRQVGMSCLCVDDKQWNNYTQIHLAALLAPSLVPFIRVSASNPGWEQRPKRGEWAVSPNTDSKTPFSWFGHLLLVPKKCPYY